jgi:hypothetical protein
MIYNDQFEEQTSQPDVEFLPPAQESNDELNDNRSSHSFLNSQGTSAQGKGKSMKKLDEVYQKIIKRNETMTNKSNNSQVGFDRSLAEGS